MLPGVVIAVVEGTDYKERFRAAAAVVVEDQDFVEGVHVVTVLLVGPNLNEGQD